MKMANQPRLMIDSDLRHSGRCSVSVHNLDPDFIASLGSQEQADRQLRSMLRVTVIGVGTAGDQNLPDVFGRHEILESGVRFIPHFPFDSGVRFRAIFDPRPLVRAELLEVLALEFSLPKKMCAARTQVRHVFPSGDALPENLLRFYVCFSNPMQRGRAQEHISLLGPDGEPAPDTLYRPPVELWDRSMRRLTVLLDPGRLKRGTGPNRELGPPLKAGQQYTLAIASGMVDNSGCPLHQSFVKSFHVTEAVREPIAVEQWTVEPPLTKSRQPLVVMFPQPLDWALLRNRIAIESEDGRPVAGRIATDQGEKQWSFVPDSPWAAGAYCVRVLSSLEDVSGNSLLAAFDRPLQSTDSASRMASRRIPLLLS